MIGKYVMDLATMVLREKDIHPHFVLIAKSGAGIHLQVHTVQRKGQELQTISSFAGFSVYFVLLH